MTFVRLRHIAQVNPQTPEFDDLDADAEVTFVPLECVWPDSRLDLSRRRAKSEVATGYVRFRVGDVLCPKVTPTFQAGRSALISSMPTVVGAASTEVHVIRIRQGSAEPRFVRYNLLTKPFLDEGVARFQGVAGLQRVPDEFIRDLPLQELSLDAQRRISDFLDDQLARIDGSVARRRAQVDLLSAHLAAVGAEIFEAVRSETPGVQLRWLITEVDQRTTDLSDLPLLAVSIHRGVVPRSSIVDDPWASNAPAGYKIVRPGDLVLNRMRAFQGGVGVSDYEGAVSPDYAVLRPVAGVLSKYLHFLFRSPWFVGEMVSRLRGLGSMDLGTVRTPRINIDDLKTIVVPCPDAEVQRDIARRLAEMDDRDNNGRSLLEQHIAALEELRRALITAAVEGNLDIASTDGKRVPV